MASATSGIEAGKAEEEDECAANNDGECYPATPAVPVGAIIAVVAAVAIVTWNDGHCWMRGEKWKCER